jgi:hypothetical protein
MNAQMLHVLAVAATEHGASTTVGPSLGLVLWTAFWLVLVVAALYGIVRWGRSL